ncbi:hypothetical protein NN561_003865 [Cricetulus griseus]
MESGLRPCFPCLRKAAVRARRGRKRSQHPKSWGESVRTPRGPMGHEGTRRPGHIGPGGSSGIRPRSPATEAFPEAASGRMWPASARTLTISEFVASRVVCTSQGH